MSVEIKELVIRAVVEPTGQQYPRREEEDASGGDQQALVEACVKEVLRILKRAEER
jgi:hypothetical protein